MRVTERMVSEFKEHMIWRQLEKDAMDRIALLKDELSLLDPHTQTTELCRHQGRIDGILFIVGSLDDYLLESKVSELERKQHKINKEE